jgi:hypothetical protein
VSNLVGNAMAHSSTDVDVIVGGAEVDSVFVSVHNV